MQVSFDSFKVVCYEMKVKLEAELRECNMRHP